MHIFSKSNRAIAARSNEIIVERLNGAATFLSAILILATLVAAV
jgi:hypothetical protein